MNSIRTVREIRDIQNTNNNLLNRLLQDIKNILKPERETRFEIIADENSGNQIARTSTQISNL